MKKIKYIFPILLFCICLNVKAIDACTTEEMSRLKELANKIEIKTDYHIEEDKISKQNNISDYFKVVYTVNIINMNEDLIIKYKNADDIRDTVLDTSNLSDFEFNEGGKIKFNIYAYTLNMCTNELLRTITIDFPIYNTYYYENKEKCSQNPRFKYCKEFMDVSSKSNEEIDKEFEEYIKQNNSNISTKNIKNILHYYYVLLPVLIIIVIIVIIIIRRKKRYSDL